jgi:imidazolonepropionase-like amidohydrolase
MKTRRLFSNRIAFALGLGLSASFVSAALAAGPITVFKGARLIDGTGRAPIENSVLVVQDGKIVAAGPSTATAQYKDATVVDLTGRTIMPGLVNAHGHLGLTKGDSLNPENYNHDNVAKQLAQYEGYGVTGVLSLGLNRVILYDWRNEQKAGKLPGADIFIGDRGIGVMKGAPPLNVADEQVYRPNTPDEARAAVKEMATRHPDMLKIWVDDLFGSAAKMPPEIFTALIAQAHAAADEAHKHGLRVAAHVFYLADAKALLDAGIDAFAHSIRDTVVDPEFIAAIKAKGIPYIPTLSLDESQFIYAEDPPWAAEPFFTAAVDPVLIAKWKSEDYRTKLAADPRTPKNKAASANGLKNVKLLFDAGVPIAMGTDSGGLMSRIQGFGEHRELQLLVQAGLKPMDAIVAATRTSAGVVGASDRGTLEPGKRADFLVLAANPLDDIRNTTKLVTIYHAGNAVTPIVPTTVAAK